MSAPDFAAGAGSQVTIAELHERSYVSYADRPAVLHGQRTLTYRELGARVHRLADGLRGLGVARGDRVVILLDNCAEYFEIDQALFVGGYIRVAVSPRLHPDEVLHVLGDCDAKVVFASPTWIDRLHERAAELEHHTALVAVGGQGRLTYHDILETGDDCSPDRLPLPEEPAALLYTSGTTGTPKGATLSHRNWLAMVRNSMVELPPVSSRDVVLHAAPLSHLSGYASPTYFARGAAHVAMSQFDPDAALDLVLLHRVTVIPVVPTILNLLLTAAESRADAYPSLHTILYAGSPVAPDRLVRARAVFGDVFVQFYGLSEIPMPLTCLSAEDHAVDPGSKTSARLASAGRVNPLVELRLVDVDGAPVRGGEVGEIVVRSDTTMLGYWNRPEATAEMIRPTGWARTGDLGRFDAHGYLYIVDRMKDMIISGGYNVYPVEVENAIATLRAVREVAVIGVPDETWGEAVTACVVTREGHQLAEADVVRACTERLAGYKKPRVVRFFDELPKTGSGKLKKGELRRLFEGASPL